MRPDARNVLQPGKELDKYIDVFLPIYARLCSLEVSLEHKVKEISGILERVECEHGIACELTASVKKLIDDFISQRKGDK